MTNRIQVFFKEHDIKELMDAGLTLPEIIQKLLKIGYKGFQFPERISESLGRYHSQEEINYIRSLPKKVQISFHHDQKTANLALKKDLDKAKQSIDKAVALGADYIVFHFGTIELGKDKKIEEKWDTLAENINNLIQCGGRKIAVSIENVRVEYSDINGFEEIKKRLHQAGKELKITLDTGHAFVDGALLAKVKNNPNSMFQSAKEYISSFIDKLGKNIHNTHLHDNTLFKSDHMVIGDGQAPIEFTLRKLFEVGYRGNLLYEINIERWRDEFYKNRGIFEIYQIAYDRLLNAFKKLY